MVLFYHSEYIFSLGKYWGIKTQIFYFGANGVDFFFVLSGIVIFHAHSQDIGRKKAVARYAWRRFRRIYPIYWIVLAAMLVLYFAVPAFGNGYERQPAVILDSILLLPLTQVVTVVPIAWTLFHEVMFYILFSTLIVSRKLGAILLSLWMCWSFLSLLIPARNQVLAAVGSPLHLLFGLGLLVLLVVTRMTLQGPILAIIGIVGLCACGAYEDVTRSLSIAVPLFTGVSSAVAVTGTMAMERRGRLRVPDSLKLLGNASYSLYLVHFMILSLAAKILFPISQHHHLPTPIAFALAVGLAIGGGLAVHLYLEVPLLNRIPTRLRMLG